jgi:predicted secreted protein
MRVLSVPVQAMALATVLAIGLAGPAASADTLLRLSETARVMTHPDELVAALRAEASAPTAAEAQARVNAAIAHGLEQSKQVAGIAATTGSYNVWTQMPRDRAQGREEWRAAQTLDLKGNDGAALLRLVGVLQAQGFAVERLAWQLAPETARRARTEATRQALGALRARADEAAGILGLRFDSFREVRLDNVRPPAPSLRAMAAPAMAAAPPPSAEAEDVAVEAGVEADAVLVSR